MSLHRYGARRDANEKTIRQALHAVGAETWQISQKGLGDLLVRYRGELFMGEVKTATGKLEKTQTHGFPVWRTPAEALATLGIALSSTRSTQSV